MIKTTLFCSVRTFCFLFSALPVLLFSAPLLHFLPDEEVTYEGFIETLSEWQHGTFPIQNTQSQELKGELILKSEPPLQFPVAFTFSIESLRLALKEKDHTHISTLENPGPSMELSELKAWQGKPLSLLSIETWPFVKLAGKSEKLKNFQVFESPFFASLVGEDLHLLFSLQKQPLTLGETFRLEIGKSPEHPFIEIYSFLVKEIDEQHLELSYQRLIERQRINAQEPVVIYGQLQGEIIVRRDHALLFSLHEQGSYSFVTKVNDQELHLKQQIDKKVVTSKKEG